MTQDEIIKLANEAELCQWIWIDDEGPEIASLVAFAKLVAEKERDKFCASLRQFHDSISLASDSNAIRARGQS